MNAKMKAKLLTDVWMTGILLFLMPYELVGRVAHEWLGTGLLVLFILHHILNGRWIGNLHKGKYTLFRILQTVLAVLVLVFMLGSMVSGIILSRYVFSFLNISGMAALSRSMHMTCAYWGFVCMSLHLGIHWGMAVRMAGKLFKRPSAVRKWTACILAVLVAGYGVSAFIKREIGKYMLMQIPFVFFNFEEPVIFFILDYTAAMGLFVFIGYYLCKWTGRKKNGKAK